ncbi:glucose-1-phosphate cytidylyltransferase (CDP-glucose pyrophosphorylase) [Legionella sainthelensi]|uniref:Glucose-1-phosphate cytidylyltransferase n=1 Tax=Legionella sainthelensi TaxID=28087 RepID=A0A2H5FJ07_9GAMM|nr:glucose-1-phosphate cytidylyltransferase [Legionella sainthelensi]AUH71526.1 glucose-1-phosphate cytidylyltransferase [Legionella sainthelensi]VEB32658.1 glucose-1-phosphate cytidylyltransferase (CDP-glucose pyrophosphorylase) [Legionella sainthelensi]
MKAVILAGGMGTRISEETLLKPKPMIEIGGKPILWHIMKIYSAHNINDFIICLGYKGYLIKEYFINYFYHTSDVTIDMKRNTTEIHQSYSEPWRVTLVDTGENSMTGGRLKRIREHLGEEDFCFTYGDGVANVNITQLVKFHKLQKRLATVTAIKPPARFGAINIDGGKIINFQEKPYGGNGWANGGFFVLSPQVIEYISDDTTIWEREPMERLTEDNQLSAFQHEDFWYAMDTLRDKNYLEELWASKQAPWKIW